MSKMKSYLDRLSALSLDQTMLDSDRLVLFLSGSSDVTCAGLTAGQLDLLHAICPSGYSVVASNFPFNQDFEHIKSPQVSLLLPATSNVIYYWHTILNFRFQKLLQEHLSPLLEAQEVVLVCKSSGVNMLTQWLRSLGNQVTLLRLRVIALGPVSQLLLNQKELELLVIKGKKDPYSCILDHHSADIQVDTDHYSYEYREDVKGIIYDWIRKSDKNRCD
ncbi:hypothetical protein HMPREF1195_00456 [Streptococcus parasanguinis CC87K]|jgi:hypothetical protein|uniref:Ig-like domain-containing protein n=1 Tax=Streptococcus parasanguinis CC87K TaxID=1073372 RepID=V8BI14_STRPA|nr:hypothetical protein [Streptococcus parasanguinis]ETD14136.1 hypothetical protein HMPREF1195_00456 [Streptococcus parasanguinis CC87K]